MVTPATRKGIGLICIASHITIVTGAINNNNVTLRNNQIFTQPILLFRYIAIKTAKLAGGSPTKILIIFGLITAVGSAFLDNVTTVLLIAPVTMVICEAMQINPIPFLMTEIIMSNIGGTATMIGDPPNIMIGTSTGLSFISFIAHPL